MKEALQQHQNLTQQQTLTPQQVQFVRLLEMNAPALEEEVRNRLDENPALEVVDSPREETFNETAEQLQSADYSDDDRPTLTRPASSRPSASELLENDADTISLSDNLRDQLSQTSGLDARTRAMAEYLIGNLDDNGWLTRTLTSIADDITIATGHEVSRADLRPAFDAVRALEPAGIGAVDLRDCLLLQLQRRKKDAATLLATEIVDKHFDALAAGEKSRLMRSMGIKEQQYDEAMYVIRSLNPKPGNTGADFSREDAAIQISPDFTVEPDPQDDGRFVISLNQRVPELAVAESYRPANYEQVAHSGRYAQERAFIRSRAQEASDLISILQRRTVTLMQVMRTIVDIQQRFFVTEDPSDIRPMVLRDIGARTGLDLSVISRATAGKYVATAGGVYPLKMFFSEAPTDDSGLSQKAIMHTLKQLIESEDKKHPLSDDALAEALAAKNMPIARRTVMKYREQMNIPNSRARRAPR